MSPASESFYSTQESLPCKIAYYFICKKQMIDMPRTPTNGDIGDNPISFNFIKHTRKDFSIENKELGSEGVSLSDTSRWSKVRLRGSINQDRVRHQSNTQHYQLNPNHIKTHFMHDSFKEWPLHTELTNEFSTCFRQLRLPACF